MICVNFVMQLFDACWCVFLVSKNSETIKTNVFMPFLIHWEKNLCDKWINVIKFFYGRKPGYEYRLLYYCINVYIWRYMKCFILKWLK